MDGYCQAVKTDNTTSVSIATLAPGCVITIYTDEFCSFNPTRLDPGDCTSIGAFIGSFSVDGCIKGLTGSLTTKRVPLTTTTTTGTATTDATTTDSSPSNTDSSIPSAGGDSQTTYTGTSSPESTNPPDNDNQKHSDLSNGAVAGIAVGATIAVLALAALLVRWFLNSRRPTTPPAAPDYTAHDEEPERRRGFWPFVKRKPSYATFPPPPSELAASYAEGEPSDEYAATTGVGTRPPMDPVYELSTTVYGELPTATSPINPAERYKDFPAKVEEMISPMESNRFETSPMVRVASSPGSSIRRGEPEKMM
ncbi:hypothetical protein AA313_de0205490 [Arthrobotrys entomopaga]|nr:hypothetical protein AA313_de0205490 [Arthrobotrys entomopaga]